MPVHQLKNVNEFNMLMEETKNYLLGKVIVMIFEDGPVNDSLWLQYELASR